MNDVSVQRINLKVSMNLYEGFIVSVNFLLPLGSDRDKVYGFLYVVVFFKVVIEQTHVSKFRVAKTL